MKRGFFVVAVFLTLALVAGGVSFADEWAAYRAEKYGFEMLIPEEAKPVERQWEGGWAGLYVAHEGVKLYGIAKLGAQATLEEIENYGVKVSGIPADHWTKITEGSNSSGWKKYRVYKAVGGQKVIYAGLGTGPKGSYLLFLETTAETVEEDEEDYETWYESLEVF